jgi:serine phosphatase RsbU (regulator of sigma subunit)
VIETPSGLRFFAAGPLVAPAVAVIALTSIGGFYEALRAARAAPPGPRRRQLWGGLVALAVAFFGLVDVFLAYGIGYAPVSWFFVAAGTLLALRSILLDDLLRARAIDSRAPIAFLGFSISAGAAWILARHVTGPLPPWATAGMLFGAALGARMTVALVARLWSIRVPGESPLDRLLAQYASRVHQLARTTEIAALTREVVELALGGDAAVIVPAREDWSWQRGDGTPLEGDHVPDPLLVPWLAERPRTIFLAELDAAGLADLRPSIDRLFVASKAIALVPLVARDDLVGLLLIGERSRRRGLRGSELALLAGVADRASSALDYARIADEVAARAELVRDVELAAAVQAGFVPGPEPVQHAGLTVVGSWQPASECGGDWWSRYPLPDGQTLVVIGDVTGSGVAAAMVTAAARGACDAAVRAQDDRPDVMVILHQLDQAVRQVGAGRFHLTCFAALVDPAGGEIKFANAGHVAPYVCRPRAGGPSPAGDTVELSALVSRGNPLGAGAATVAKLATRPFGRGDLVIWYTDGLIECHGADGKPFGDRRLQRVLRRLPIDELDPVAVQNRLAGELAAHLGGLPIDDDMTLVVARFDPDPS